LVRRFGDRVLVVGSIRCVGNGSRWDDGLGAAVMLAREIGPGTVVLAETVARLLRHRDYHSVKNPDVLPNRWQWNDVRDMAEGVVLATMLHPDAPPAWVRRYEAQRGTRRKAAGSKKATWLALAPQAVRLKAEGLSVRRIGTELGVPYRTVGHWLKEGRNGTERGWEKGAS
jgi:hypothetical protein